jgi:NAD(P)-dependent dehydrogenase (short-subunit alcohol dehydrogenase family)
MATVPRSLAGMTVAITGGARGIGRATAAALIAQGSHVAIGDIDAALAERTAAELGDGTIGLALDVTDRSSFAVFLDQVEARLGPIDVLINNAGIMPVGPFLEESDACADRILDINVRGVILGSKLALERFVARGQGHLVNIASIAGKTGVPYDVTYCASKYAVVGLTEALRLEFAATGIAFSVVLPIGTNTELYSGLQQLRGMATPEPEDVAEAIVEALQTGRYEVWIPRRMEWLVRSGSVLPRRAVDAFAKWLGSDRALAGTDHAARAAYEARMSHTISVAESHLAATPEPPTPEPVTPEPDAEPEAAKTEAA